MKNRVHNFGAGPAMLPEAILLEAQNELLNWQGLGLSILEIGHRSPEFQALLAEAEADLRFLLTIPDNYQILFLGGAARTQFAMLPMNLLQGKQQGAYLLSGVWSDMAYEEACKIAKAYQAASTKALGYKRVPAKEQIHLETNTAYLYYTPNETVNGVRFPYTPKIDHLDLLADMTSCLLSEPIRIEDYAVIFAGAQKNIANAGLTLVIIRSDLLEKTKNKSIATMLDYNTHAENHSLYATPPVFNCYLAAKMFKWIKQQGGVSCLYEQNIQKSTELYDYIDESNFYDCPVEKGSRSIVNVCFSIRKKELENCFVEEAQSKGLIALRGHRLVGGLRASLYNAMPIESVRLLISFMQKFAKDHH